MPIRIVRLGSPREKGEGLRIGTVRRPPRGVRKEDYARLDYYDIWLPQLAPSDGLVSWVRSAEITPARWKTFTRRFLKELSAPDTQRLLALLVEFSKHTSFSVGCFCQDESRCHRSILREELKRRGAVIV